MFSTNHAIHTITWGGGCNYRFDLDARLDTISVVELMLLPATEWSDDNGTDPNLPYRNRDEVASESRYFLPVVHARGNYWHPVSLPHVHLLEPVYGAYLSLKCKKNPFLFLAHKRVWDLMTCHQKFPSGSISEIKASIKTVTDGLFTAMCAPWDTVYRQRAFHLAAMGGIPEAVTSFMKPVFDEFIDQVFLTLDTSVGAPRSLTDKELKSVLFYGTFGICVREFPWLHAMLRLIREEDVPIPTSANWQRYALTPQTLAALMLKGRLDFMKAAGSHPKADVTGVEYVEWLKKILIDSGVWDHSKYDHKARLNDMFKTLANSAQMFFTAVRRYDTSQDQMDLDTVRSTLELFRTQIIVLVRFYRPGLYRGQTDKNGVTDKKNECWAWFLTLTESLLVAPGCPEAQHCPIWLAHHVIKNYNETHKVPYTMPGLTGKETPMVILE